MKTSVRTQELSVQLKIRFFINENLNLVQWKCIDYITTGVKNTLRTRP